MAKFRDFEYDQLAEIEKEHEKRGIFAFFDIIFRKIVPMINTNFLFLVFSLPYIILLFWFSPINASSLAGMSENMQSLLANMPAHSALTVDIGLRFVFAILVVVLWGTGPASAGIAYILRNYSRGEFAWVWADFIGTIKENFKQSMIVVLFDVVAIYLFTTIIRFYGGVMQGGISVVALIFVGFFLLLYTFMHFYIYQLMVTYEDNTKQLYKNAMLFALMRWLPNLLVLLGILAVTIALFYFLQLFALVLYVINFTAIFALVVHFNASRSIKRFVQAEIERK